jgi:hypothetical protein
VQKNEDKLLDLVSYWRDCNRRRGFLLVSFSASGSTASKFIACDKYAGANADGRFRHGGVGLAFGHGYPYAY